MIPVANCRSSFSVFPAHGLRSRSAILYSEISRHPLKGYVLGQHEETVKTKQDFPLKPGLKPENLH